LPEEAQESRECSDARLGGGPSSEVDAHGPLAHWVPLLDIPAMTIGAHLFKQCVWLIGFRTGGQRSQLQSQTTWAMSILAYFGIETYGTSETM